MTLRAARFVQHGAERQVDRLEVQPPARQIGRRGAQRRGDADLHADAFEQAGDLAELFARPLTRKAMIAGDRSGNRRAAS